MAPWEGKSWKAYRNFLRVRLERKRRSITTLGLPYVLTLDPSSYCNLRCPFCPTGQRNKRRSHANMPLDRFKHVMDELGPNLFYLDLFNWGEPFINNDLMPIIEYIRPFKIFSNVSTHFDIKMTDALAERIVSSGLSRLIISADGASQETYERYRIGGNLENVLHNLKTVSAAKQRASSATPQIVWRFLVFRHNEHEIDHAKCLAEEMGAMFDLASPYIPVAEQQYRDWVPTTPKFNKYGFAAAASDPIELPQLDHATNGGVCDWLWMSAAINANGSVSPCCGIWEEQYDFGTIDEHGFVQVWNNQTFQAARIFMKTGISPSPGLICEKCPVPDIRNYSSHYDPFILESLRKRLPGLLGTAVRDLVQMILY